MCVWTMVVVVVVVIILRLMGLGEVWRVGWSTCIFHFISFHLVWFNWIRFDSALGA